MIRAPWLLFAVFLTLQAPIRAAAQQFCRGDVNGDGEIDAADAVALEPFLFVSDSADASADANADAAVTAADLTAIILTNGAPCGIASATPTRTRSRTPSLSPTITSTPTRTPTVPPGSTSTATPTATRPTATRTASPTPAPPTATPTATATCAVHTVGIGSVDGALDLTDCQRSFPGGDRPTDVYQVAGTPGEAIKVDVVATSPSSPFLPYVAIIDPNGQFDRVDGIPPAELTVTTTLPYQILVTSRGDVSPQLGSYRLTLSTRPCPTPRAINPPGVSLGVTLREDECPEPSSVSTSTSTEPLALANPADLYTFTVNTVPTQIDITMRQQLEDEEIDPTFAVIGPDGFEVINVDEVDDNAGGILGTDAGARFLALQTGTYTIIAQGGLGHYILQVLFPPCTPRRNLTNIPADRPLVCSGQPGPGCAGTLYGNRALGTCGAPLSPPGSLDDVPEPGAGSDLYTFTGQAGDVISVELDVPDDDAYLVLLGPSSAGNPVIASDNDSGPVAGVPTAQLAATLPTAGTYTIIAANTSTLFPPDPEDPMDQGDVFPYKMYVQKCPLAGSLDPVSATPVNGRVAITNCFGFGGVPFRTYSVNGSAGQFLTATASFADPNIDPFVRIIGPDRSVAENDNDPFSSDAPEARASRILPVDGTYFVEVSTALEQGAVDPVDMPSYTVRAQRCSISSTIPATNRTTVNGTLQDSDCALADGRRFDVIAVTVPTPPRVAELKVPPNTCAVGLLANGSMAYSSGCRNDTVTLPMLTGGVYGFMIAGSTPSVRGGYSANLGICPLPSLTFADVRGGAINATSCLDASGRGADWYFVGGSSGWVQFNDGISGLLSAAFPVAATQSDLSGVVVVNDRFIDDASSLFANGGNSGLLLKVGAATAADRGAYTVAVDQAERRQ